MKRAVVVAVALLAVAVGAACGGEASFEERWAKLGVDEAEFVFIGDFTPEQQAAIRLELKTAQVIYAEHFGAVTSDFRVYASTDLDLLNERLAADARSPVSFTCRGLANQRVVTLMFEDCRDEILSNGGFIAHEYFHVLQWDAGNIAGARSERSVWWVAEASAVYANALVDDALGRRSLTARRQGEHIRWSAIGEPFLSGPRSASHPYTLGFLATEWLVSEAGPEAVLKFFRLGGHKAAFLSAFGMSAVGFEWGFEDHRLEVAPPFEWSVAGTVVDPDGRPIEGLDVYAWVRIEGELWSVGTAATDAQGNFGFAAPGSGYTIDLFLRCPRDDDLVQWVHAGELDADGFTPDADGFLEPDDEGGEPFTDGERDRTDMVIELPETRESLIAKHCES